MKPLENILLVAAQQNLQSGNVQAVVSAPGCTSLFRQYHRIRSASVGEHLHHYQPGRDAVGVSGQLRVDHNGTIINLAADRD